MNKSLYVLVVLGLLGFGCLRASAQETKPYRDRTGTQELSILLSEEPLQSGSIGHSAQSNGDLHDVQIDVSAATTRYRVRSPSRKIDYTVTRNGDALSIQGVLAGRSISSTIRINGRPWYQAIERSLHDYVVAYVATGVTRPLTFWVVQPWTAKAYLLQAKAERQEQITVNGRRLTGVRVKVSPTGLLRFVWSSLYWYRPNDAIFLRYEAVRGLPGTPRSVVEFMGKS